MASSRGNACDGAALSDLATRSADASRPGAPEGIAALERRLGRPLAPGKPGSKPRVDRRPERQQRML